MRPGRVSRPGRPPLIIWCCEDNQRSDGGRRPQRRLTLPAGRSRSTRCWAGSRAGSLGWNFGGGPGRSCAGCSRTCRARTAGRSPSTPATPARMGCSTCWPGRCGTHDAVRDDVRDYVVEHLGDPEAVLVVDETGDLKKGTAHRRGAAPVHRHRRPDRERPGRRLPGLRHRCAGTRWSTGSCTCPGPGPTIPSACRRPASPTEVGFATKPELAQAMICRALDAGVPAAWVTGDEVYGANPGLRAELEARGIGYVLAVACDHRVPVGGGTHRADGLLRRVPARAWQQVSCGKGAKGHRLYDWAFIRLDHDGPRLAARRAGTGSWSAATTRTGELAFYRCFTPRPVPLAVLVRVAGGAGPLRSGSRPARAWWPGPAPGAPLALLVPLGHPGDARPRLPGRGGLDRTHPPPTTARADRVDLQRDPALVRGTARAAHR